MLIIIVCFPESDSFQILQLVIADLKIPIAYRLNFHGAVVNSMTDYGNRPTIILQLL